MMIPSDSTTTVAIVLAGSVVTVSLAIATKCLGACRGWGSSRVEGPKVKCKDETPPKVVRVDAIAPDWDMAAGGTPVTITGAGFDPGVSVFINGTMAGHIVRTNDTTLTASVPPGLAGGPYAVRAVNVDGTEGTRDALFTYRAPATVTAVNAVGVNGGNARGTTDGNTPVTLTGTHFRGTPTVRFGGQNALAVVRVSDTQLTANTPPHVAAQVAVEVINPGEPGVTLADAFLYTLPRPTGITPAEGGLAGGQRVTIDGECFGDPVGVSINGQPATNVVRVSEVQLTADAPAMGERFANLGLRVTVTNTSSNQSGNLSAAFRYPRLTVKNNLQPPAGTYEGNTAVTLTGTGFSPRTRVRFGGVDAAVVCDRHDQLIATTGALPSPGDLSVDVQVDEGTQSVTLADAFTYYGRALAGAMHPAEANHEGGDQVSLFGVGFSHTTVVHVGERQAAAVLMSGNELRVTIPQRVAPASPAALLPVSVTDPGVRLPIADAFTYQALRPARNVVVYPGGANSFDNFVAAAGNTDSIRTLLREMHNVGATAAEHRGMDQPVGGLFHAHINGNADGVMWTRVQDVPDRINQLIDLSNGRVGNNYNNQWIHTANGMWFPASNAEQGVRVGQILAAYALPVGHATVTTAVNDTFRLVGLSPATGPLGGGWNVTITAENVPDNVAVRFGAVDGTNVVRVSNTTITVDVPARVAPGTVNVRVTDTDRGIYAELLAAFRYEALAVTAITPSIGDHAGGQFVVIRGTGFEVGATVAFTATPPTNLTVHSPTCITANAPALGAGNVVVTVTNPVSGNTATIPFQYFQ